MIDLAIIMVMTLGCLYVCLRAAILDQMLPWFTPLSRPAEPAPTAVVTGARARVGQANELQANAEQAKPVQAWRARAGAPAPGRTGRR